MSATDRLNSECVELKNCQRYVELYLRALWGKGFVLQYAEAEKQTDKCFAISYINDNNIHLPDQVPIKQHSLQYYRAAATHAALHAVYGGQRFEVDTHNLMQRNMIGLVEDLRVELLAIKEFPGLRKLWLAFYPSQKNQLANSQNLMARLSRSVLDPAYEDAHMWVNKGKQLILDKHDDMSSSATSLQTGLQLANDLGQMRLPLNSGRYEQLISYRDDNRCLWQDVIEKRQQADSASSIEDSLFQQRSLREEGAGIELKISGADKQAGEGYEINQREQADFEYLQHRQEGDVSRVSYPEWDYRTHVLKKDWCSLTESKGDPGCKVKVTQIFDAHKDTLMRLRHVAKRLQTEKRQRIRKIMDGDEIDLDPMINAMVAIRARQIPDDRVFMQQANRQEKDMAVSILLDLSESTNAVVRGTGMTMSALMRDAVLLLGETLSIAGERFAISGFSSNGRHQVKLTNFKTFSETFDDSKASLAGIHGEYSTRLGAAIRHSERSLLQQTERKKLLLVITDGAPSDIDVYDNNYLQHDSWHAVHALARSGIKSFCLNLDSRAGPVIEHIFGIGRFETLDNVARLPEVLSCIYLRTTRHKG